MKSRPTPIAAAAALALLSVSLQAQQAEPAKTDAEKKAEPEAQTVTVTGIRASRQKSIAAKRDADSVVDVVTAEDIGKLPDKNIADAVQRLPGVNISKASAGEGGFSENDRVSIRGTDPSLTQTLVNGHSIATADWFIQSQVGTVGRSVSYSLLPSEITDTIVVHKSAQADLVEGGVAGLVDIHTRTPLSFKKPFTAEATLQAFHNDLPKKTDAQISALFNWKNEAGTAGALIQLFSETRHERRDGQEFIGYGRIPETLPDANGNQVPNPIVVAHPELKDVYYPELINATLLQHQRKRRGGMFDVEFKPMNDLTLDLNGYYSHMDAPSYDTSFLANPAGLITAGRVPTAFTVRSGTLVSASWDAADDGGQPGIVDKIYRPFASSETKYLDLNGKYVASDHLTLSGKAGTTRALGKTLGDLGYEAAWTTGGLQYAMNALSAPAVVTFPGMDTTNFNDPNVVTNAAWHSIVKTPDKETYAQADAELAIDNGIWESVKFGVRFTKHERRVDWPEDGNCPDDCLNNKPAWSGEQYPSNFGRGLNPPPGYVANYWQLDPNAVLAFENQFNPASARFHNWQSEFTVAEKTAAVYAMANLAGDKWRGNFGVRIVRTRENGLFYCLSANALTGSDSACNDPNSTNDGSTVTPYFNFQNDPNTPTYFKQSTNTQNYVDVLPSANLKLDLTKNLVSRFAVSRTMTRPDYSALAPAPVLDDLALTGNIGNPDLKPIRSTNFDATLEWYFAPKALLSVGVFYMDLSSFVAFAASQQLLNNNTLHKVSLYSIAAPVNTKAKNRGIELGYQQPLAGGFGFNANATFSSGHTADGGELYGSSKFTGNAEAYYENDRFSARLAYTYRSKYLVGLVQAVPQHDAGVGSLAMSLNYKLNDRFTLTFDALNINNPILKEYGLNADQPQAFYSNGRQYFLGVRVSL